MKFIRFVFLLLNAGLLHAQNRDFIPLPVGKGERAVSLTTPQGMGSAVLLETVTPQGEVHHRLLSESGRILDLPLGWRMLPGENRSSLLILKEGRLACYYWNYSDYTKHGISFNMSPGEQSAWRNLRSESLARQETAPQKGCGFGFDDDAGMHHKWLIAAEGVRELAHHPIKAEASGGNPSISGAACLESCYNIRGVHITNTGYGYIEQSGAELEDHSSEVDNPEFVCDPNEGLQVRYSKTKSRPVSPAMDCDESLLYQPTCGLNVLVTRKGSGRTVSITDIDQAKVFRSLPIDEGDHTFIDVNWCFREFFFLSNGIAYWVGDPSWKREMKITTLHPESLSPISRQETDLK
jgi:hypothetical protein